MARSRKARSRAVRVRPDWVYRANLTTGASPLNASDVLGTYDFGVKAISTGASNAQVLWLYDSRNRMGSNVLRQSSTTFGYLAGSARAEGTRPKVHAVEGLIYVEPSTWAAGNLMAMGFRIGAYEQDPYTGLASLDPDYTMWNTSATQPQAAFYANDRSFNMWESRNFKSFGDNGSIMVVRVRARLNWSLSANFGLGLYVEGELTSVNCRYQCWLRTLVTDSA